MACYAAYCAGCGMARGAAALELQIDFTCVSRETIDIFTKIHQTVVIRCVFAQTPTLWLFFSLILMSFANFSRYFFH